MLRSEAYQILIKNSCILPSILANILDSFSHAFDKKVSALEYEISVKVRGKEVGLQTNPTYKTSGLRGAIQQQKTAIIDILMFLNRNLKTNFPVNTLKRIFVSFTDSKSFAYHFGFEISRNKIPRFKIYFIPERNILEKKRNIHQHDDFYEFFDYLTSKLKLKKEIHGKIKSSINAFGIDCYDTGRIELKIYIYSRLTNDVLHTMSLSKDIAFFVKKYAIIDSDLLYRFNHFSRSKKASKIYFYPKPPLSLRETDYAGCKKISRQIKDVCGDCGIKLENIRITALGIDMKNCLQAYLC